MYDGHPYGRSVRGTHASIGRAASDAAVRAAFATHFRRANAALAFAGDIAEDEARELGGVLCAALRAGDAVHDPVPEPVGRGGRHLVFVDKPDRTQTQILIGTLASHPHDADHVPLVVANSVFGGTFTARLMREVRSKRGWSYGASSRLGVDRRRQPMTLWTFPAQGDAAPCIALEIGLLEALVKDGITPRELQFAARYMSRSWAFEVDTASKRVHQALDVEVLGLPADYYASHVSRVKAATVDACNAALAAHVRPDDLLVCVVGTHAEIGDKVAKAIPNLASRTVVPFDAD
jgi:zinc protease